MPTIIIGIIAKTEDAYIQIIKVLDNSHTLIKTNAMASTIYSSISLRSLVSLLTILPTGILL